MTFAQLTGTQTFGTVCGGNFNGLQRLQLGGSPLGTDFFSIVSDRGVPTYQVNGTANGPMAAFSTTFTQADRDTTATGEAYRKTTANGFTERFSIFPLTSGGTELPYVRVSSIVAQNPNGFSTLACAYGVPTIPTDRPPATVNYTGLASLGTADVTTSGAGGPTTQSFVINSSVLTMSANPANGEVRFSLDLKGRLLTGGMVSTTVTDLGVFTGTETLDGTAPRFAGVLMDQGNAVAGTFGGGFLGPQGVTPAVSVGIRTRRADGSDLLLGGLFVLRPATAP